MNLKSSFTVYDELDAWPAESDKAAETVSTEVASFAENVMSEDTEKMDTDKVFAGARK